MERSDKFGKKKCKKITKSEKKWQTSKKSCKKVTKSKKVTNLQKNK